MAERDWEDGLGEFSASAVELSTGKGLVLVRFDSQPDALEIYAPLAGNPREPVSKLLTALDLLANVSPGRSRLMVGGSFRILRSDTLAAISSGASSERLW
jgi:hypothetical protein